MPTLLRTTRSILAAAALSGLASLALALDTPTGQVILTISGSVTQTNRGGNAVFDLAMLEKLPQKKFSAQTPWYPTAVTFTGPLLRDVLAAAGSKGSKIVAVALNDYKTEIPFDDAIKFDPIVAHQVNGKPMSVREKGPLFIIYPFDSKAELRTETYYNRSAWQLNSLKVQ